MMIDKYFILKVVLVTLIHCLVRKRREYLRREGIVYSNWLRNIVVLKKRRSEC